MTITLNNPKRILAALGVAVLFGVLLYGAVLYGQSTRITEATELRSGPQRRSTPTPPR